MNLYIALKKELELASCFERDRYPFLCEMSLVSLVSIVGYSVMLLAPPFTTNLFILFCLAFVWVRAGFISHEASHNNLFSHRHSNQWAGQLFLTLLTGVSYSLFQKTHHWHHAHPEDTSDVRPHGGTISLFNRTREYIPTQLQGGSLWLLSIFRAYSLHLEGLNYLFSESKKTFADQYLLLIHYFAWLVVPSMILGASTAIGNYLIINLIAGLYVGPLLLLSHTGHQPVSVTEENKLRLETILTATRNIKNSAVIEFLLKGTREHVEHHIFPSIPYHKLRESSTIIARFCQQHHLDYSKMELPRVLHIVSNKRLRK
ncbi:fatty acid desaturase family protein [Vibrio ouci]|uniref:Fatty acid desaturase domain-containing protein n=1 Tax=Vibrio ouci TaxID=2499078 RepID=A0A4Y8W8S5_9VIBR|nr:fatty acid desaturase [Vibrio ouci]TFH89332.1 hypothetical protein ELS82_22825 [Vibrio ouci]